MHLELRSNAIPTAGPGGYSSLGPTPGTAYDPGMDNALFDTPLIQSGVNDNIAPEIKALYVWGKNPRTAAFAAASPGSPAIQLANGESCKALVAQIVDIGGNPAFPKYLVPSHIEFAVEDPASGALTVRDSFDYGREGDTSNVDVKRLFQYTTGGNAPFENFGYVRRANNACPPEVRYQYWFKWDTTVYEPHKRGPRKVSITAKDRANPPTTGTFTFGPQLTAPATFAPAGTPAGSTFDLKVRNFMGPFPSGMTGTPQDTIKLTLVTAGLTSWEATFDENSLPDLDKILTGHDAASEQSVPVRVKRIAGGTDPTAAEPLTVRAASSVFPDIAHEVRVEITPAPTCGGGPSGTGGQPPPDGFVLIPAGSFEMGDSFHEWAGDEVPVHTVNVSAFYMQATEVTYAEWRDVYTWAVTHGYGFDNAGNGKGETHPVHSVNWFDMTKWCNARSEKESLRPCYYTDAARTLIYRSGRVALSNGMVCWMANGYRLPTEAEWEKAARGGLSGKRFPWGDTISHNQANYYAHGIGNPYYSYDVSRPEATIPRMARAATPKRHPSAVLRRTGMVSTTWLGIFMSGAGTGKVAIRVGQSAIPLGLLPALSAFCGEDLGVETLCMRGFLTVTLLVYLRSLVSGKWDSG